jgi:hypothetical protein
VLLSVDKLQAFAFRSQAIELCRKFGQHWRAASLNGGKLWHDDQKLDDSERSSIGTTGSESVRLLMQCEGRRATGSGSSGSRCARSWPNR